MTPAGRQSRKIINGEEVWRKWHGHWPGQTSDMSLAEIQHEYTVMGIINPETGKSITRAGLCYSAWRWALLNLDSAMKMLVDAYANHGEIITDDEIKRLIASHAHYLYLHQGKKAAYHKFIADNHLENYV